MIEERLPRGGTKNDQANVSRQSEKSTLKSDVVDANNTLSFSLHDLVKGEPITPKNVDLVTLHQFLGDVIDLMRGDEKKSEMGDPTVEIKEGSLKIISLVSTLIASSFHADMERLRQNNDLDAISEPRATIIESWQNKAKKPESHRRYSIFLHPFAKEAEINVSAESEFRHMQADKWVNVEHSAQGKVVDIGGKVKPNIHFVPSTGESLKIGAKESQLEGADYLYKTTNVRFAALEHISTGEMKELRLIDAYKSPSEIDESQLETLWRKGKEAWEDVTNPSEWVEGLRGS